MIFLLSYILTTLVVLLTGYKLFSDRRKSRLYIEAAKLPGPPTLPFIGNSHYFIGSTQDIFNEFMRQTHYYTSPYRLWLTGRLFCVVSDPESIKTILMSPKAVDRTDELKFLYPWLGTGLFTAPAAKWRVHRKLIQPAFNQRILNSFVEVFSEKSAILIKEIEHKVNGKEFEIFDYISDCLLDIITETAMGVPSNQQTQKESKYPKAIKEVLEILFNRIFKVWLHPDIIFYYTKTGKNAKKYIEYLHEFTNDVIRRKKEYLKTNDTYESKNEFLASLDVLIKLQYEGTKITDVELREEVDIIIAGGYDTTSKAISLAMLMLASHPEIQDKVYEELYGIYGDEDPSSAPVKTEDLSKMEYLGRVIKETLRLFPGGAFIMRRVTDDLEMGNYTLIKGTSIVLGVIRMHRSEEYWKDPLTFDPDRFLPEECAKRHPFVYLPFSGGPRNCIGINYATMSIKAVLATVVRKYVMKKDNIVPIKDIKFKLNVSLTVVDPITMRIEKRSRRENTPN